MSKILGWRLKYLAPIQKILYISVINPFFILPLSLMTYPLLFETVLQAAMSWPLNSALKGPNCVTAVDIPSDLSSPPPFEAYIAGHFWQRDWVASGAKPSDISLARPLIGIERKRVTLSLPDAVDGCSEVWITLLDDPCDKTAGCAQQETIEQLQRRLLDTLTELVRRMTAWQLWKLNIGGYAVYNPLLPGAIPPVGVNTKLKLFEAGEVDIRITELPEEAGLNNARSAAVGLTVCGCIKKLTSEDFVTYTRPIGLGEPKCELC